MELKLYTGYNKNEDFRILISAASSTEAEKLANKYLLEAELTGSFIIDEYIGNELFDCNYIIQDSVVNTLMY